MVAQRDRQTDFWAGHRRIYQDLKRQLAIRRTGIVPLSEAEIARAQAVLDADIVRRENSQRRVEYRRKKRKRERADN